MGFKVIKNNRTVKLKDMAEMPLDTLRHRIISSCLKGRRLIGFFAGPHEKLYVMLADDAGSTILTACAPLNSIKHYRSLTPDLPQAHMFEREFYEETGIEPIGHPRSEEHTSELQSRQYLVCRLLLEKKSEARRAQQGGITGHCHSVSSPPGRLA